MSNNAERITKINERITSLRDRAIQTKANKESLEKTITEEIAEIAKQFPDLKGISIDGDLTYEKVEAVLTILRNEAKELREKENKLIEEAEKSVSEIEAKLKEIDNEAV